MSGGNVTILQLATTTTAVDADDRFPMWQTTASATVQVTASQVSEGVFSVPVVATNQTTATAATAGSVDLPSGPAGFFQLSLNGTVVNVPYYSV